MAWLSAEDKWQKRSVRWEALVGWIGNGCPQPITGTATFSGGTRSPEEKAVEFVGPVFEQCETRVRGKRTEWVIHGYEGMDLLVDERVSSRDLGPGGIHELLRSLACIHLAENEIIAASTGAIPHLALSHTKGRLVTVGDPHYVALTIDPDD